MFPTVTSNIHLSHLIYPIRIEVIHHPRAIVFRFLFSISLSLAFAHTHTHSSFRMCDLEQKADCLSGNNCPLATSRRRKERELRIDREVSSREAGVHFIVIVESSLCR